MKCKNICKLCNNLVISSSVTFNGTSLVINIPAGSYNDNCKYCIVVAQAIPSITTVNAPVVITIGTGTVQYPVLKCNCRPLTACGVRTRTKYSMCVETSATSAVFRLLGNVPCCSNNLTSVNGTAPTTTATPSVEAAAIKKVASTRE